MSQLPISSLALSSFTGRRNLQTHRSAHPPLSFPLPIELTKCRSTVLPNLSTCFLALKVDLHKVIITVHIFFALIPPAKSAYKLYLSLVRSIFEYCCQVWAPQARKALDAIEALQKRAVKWILREQHLSYSDSTYLQKLCNLDLLPMKSKFPFSDLVLFFKIINRSKLNAICGTLGPCEAATIDFSKCLYVYITFLDVDILQGPS